MEKEAKKFTKNRVNIVFTLLFFLITSAVSWAQTGPTGNVAFGGVVSSNGTYAGFSPLNAFDGDAASSGWGSSSGLPKWLEYDFGNGNDKILKRYAFVLSSTMNNGWGWNGYYPTAWTFEGYNGSIWDVLDTRTGIVPPALNTWAEYSFSNSTYYQKYRIHVTGTDVGNYTAITEMRLYETQTGCLPAANPNDITMIDDLTVCISSSTTLSATGAGTLSWYDAPIGGNYLVGGSTYVTSPITNDTAFYVQDSTICNFKRKKISVFARTPADPTITIAQDLVYGNGGNVAFGGVATASSSYGGNPPQDAFDGNSTTAGWGSNSSGVPGWLAYDFGSGNAKTIVKYTIISSSSMASGWNNTDYAPTDWTFEGYNGSTWDTLDFQIGVPAIQHSTLEYSFSNTTAFEKYRLNFSGSGGGNYLTATEVTLHEAVISTCYEKLFIATVNSVTNPAMYQWSVNGFNVGVDSSAFLLSNFQLNDTVRCTTSTTNTCIITTNSAVSNVEVIAIGPPNIATSTSVNTISAIASGADYQWIDCSDNSIINGETSQSFTAVSQGSYAVIVDNGICAPDTSTCVIVNMTGVDENIVSNKMIIYPNPSRGEFNVQASFEGNYLLSNELGQTIRYIKLNSDNKYMEKIEGLKSGIYIISGFNNNQIIHQKIIVTN